MITVHGAVRVGGHRLPDVLSEIVRALCEDDWIRRSTDDGATFYYVAGATAWRAGEAQERRFTVEDLPKTAPLTPVQESALHAQVAQPKRPRFFVDRSARRLKAAGADPRTVDDFVAACSGEGGSLEFQRGAFRFEPGSEASAAFGDLLNALSMQAGVDDDVPTEADARAEAETATEKFYLQEVATLYRNLVQRAGGLDPLSVWDRHLNEASRCYLYGFFGAAVLLSSTAVEAALVAALPEDKRPPKDSGGRGFYPLLVEAAVDLGLLGPRKTIGQPPVLATAAKDVFDARNKVAHSGYNPTSDEAHELLTQARVVTESLRGQAS